MLLSILMKGLREEFEEETYGRNTMFYPDPLPWRDLRFFIWVLEKYGVKGEALKEADVHLTMSILGKQR